jgi:dynein intermediate chain
MSMQQRKDEILAKRAKLAELKKQRELRRSSHRGRVYCLYGLELVR